MLNYQDYSNCGTSTNIKKDKFMMLIENNLIIKTGTKLVDLQITSISEALVSETDNNI